MLFVSNKISHLIVSDSDMSKDERSDVKAYYDALTQHIKHLRKERKISQLKLSNILGHNSTSFIARIELRQNQANYNLAHLIILAKEWNLEIHDLLPPL
jgi:DNA-binding XRE family transcriptional regulator